MWKNKSSVDSQWYCLCWDGAPQNPQESEWWGDIFSWVHVHRTCQIVETLYNYTHTNSKTGLSLEAPQGQPLQQRWYVYSNGGLFKCDGCNSYCQCITRMFIYHTYTEQNVYIFFFLKVKWCFSVILQWYTNLTKSPQPDLSTRKGLTACETILVWELTALVSFFFLLFKPHCC